MGTNKHKEKTISVYEPNIINFYYGIPHCYTSVSIGSSTPYETFNYAYHNNLDFMMITDTNDFLSKEIKYDNTIITRWHLANQHLKRFQKKKDSFAPLIGFQFKLSPYGDFSIINCNSYFVGTVKNINLLILWMLNNKDAFIIINHPLKTINDLPYSDILNKLITSVEVCCGPTSRYHRREKQYYGLLDKGWMLGACNGQGNTKLDFGDSDKLTCVISSRLTKEKIVESFRSRRTYSTESKNLKMFFTVNDVFMGGVISDEYDSLKFEIYAEDKLLYIEKISIISDGGIIIKSIDSLNLHKVKYIYEHKRSENETWYVIKIHLSSQRIAISSPIFIRNKKNPK